MDLTYKEAREIVAEDNPEYVEKADAKKQLLEPLRVHARFVLDSEQANVAAQDADVITKRSSAALEEFQKKLNEHAVQKKSGIEELL